MSAGQPSQQNLVVGGFYRHYKNKLYKVHAVVRHSETLEEMVYYEALYENALGQLWVRPKNMFLEFVEVDGKVIPRFEPIADPGL